MRNETVLPSALVLATAALTGCMGPHGPLNARDTIVETRPLDADGRFSLENVNGRITVETWATPEVRIEAERAAASAEALERLKIEIEGEGDEVRVKTRHEKKADGLWLFRHGGGKVDYHISLPAGARVRLKTVNGPVGVEGVSGGLRVESVNGGLEIRDAAGEVEASTVNGGIYAAFVEIPSSGHHRFATVNGGIEVSLPEGTGGRLEARTVNGSIDCDLPLDAETRKRRRLEGRLGPGGGLFNLETVNGGIDVLRARGRGRPPAEAPTERS